MALNEQLVNIAARHAVFLQRLTGGEVRKFEPIIEQLRSGILERLARENITEFSRGRLELLLADITQLQQSLYGSYTSELNQSLFDIASSEADFEVRALSSVVNTDIDFVLPSTSQLRTALTINPLSVGRNGAGKLLEPFINDWVQSSIDTVNGIIRQGWFEGQTISQMSQAIGGRDGVLNKQIRRANQAIVRTAINHASSMARTLTWQENDDIVKGWRFIAVLDSRTTIECSSIASLNRVYDVGRGPMPPRHPGCRSTMIAELDGRYSVDTSVATQASKGASGGKQISADMSYYEWLKTQPKAFVENTIGVERARILLSGKLTAKEFADLQLNRRFEPITLAEMRELDQRLNLGLFPNG